MMESKIYGRSRYRLEEFLKIIKGGLIVSCQGFKGEPLYGSRYMAAMALAAEKGGAVGIRANDWRDIRAIKRSTKLPLIGIRKKRYPGFEPFITPTLRDVEIVIRSGADVVAIDATFRAHPDNLTSEDFIHRVKEMSEIPLMADISTLEEGLRAADSGADLISTTLSGYTSYSQIQDEPDFELVCRLVERVKKPIIAEGRILTPEQACEMLRLGAYAVTVGTAVTRPWKITERFTSMMKKCVK